jgi:transcriptional regulator GlxA family with amidase domain
MSIGFVLIEGYALMSLAAAVEPLRAANHLADKTLYQCRFYSADGGFGASTSGGGFDTAPFSQAVSDKLDLVLVVAGGNPMLHEDAALTRMLRALNQRGVKLGGISGGSAILAKSGLMTGRRFTVHWTHIDPLIEYASDLLVERALYVIDRDRYTCAGGVAAIDMMGALIAKDHGSAFARDVSEWFIHPRLRTAEEPQLSRPGQRFNVHHPALEAAIELMTTHVADPLSPTQLAQLCGSSIRQLHRLFSSHFDQSMMLFYRELRLAKADELLQQTSLSIVEVALLTGFSTAAHFTRCYTQKYAMPPSRKRRGGRDLKRNSEDDIKIPQL